MNISKINRHFPFLVVQVAIVLVVGQITEQCCHASSPPGPRTDGVILGNFQKAWHVSQHTGSDKNGDGSQSHPWQSIHHALLESAGANAQNRIAILVARGTYAITALEMVEFVDLFGGFKSTDWQRDIWNHATILDGAGSHRVLVGANHARIDGFVIKDGMVRGKGAGLLCRGTSPTVTNNCFVRNKTIGPRRWNPKQLHEIANDGGALSCENGASPVVANNIFAENETEIGRGAAIALHGRCSGRIESNVFYSNMAGTNDPMRSSDGGAISVFDWSHATIENNILLRNRALARNDGGAIFVALWSSPRIRKNMFVANIAGDDANALFIGGQEHRYDKPFDPLPEKDEFFVDISGNTFMGNGQYGRTASSVRMTMQSRGKMVNNTMIHNARLSLENSELTVTNNTILGDAVIKESVGGLNSYTITNNIFKGRSDIQVEATAMHSNIRDQVGGQDDKSVEPSTRNNSTEIRIASSVYNALRYTTQLQVHDAKYESDILIGRVMRAGNRWAVIKSNHENQILVWGNLSGEPNVLLLPISRSRADSSGIEQSAVEESHVLDTNGRSIEAE